MYSINPARSKRIKFVKAKQNVAFNSSKRVKKGGFHEEDMENALVHTSQVTKHLHGWPKMMGIGPGLRNTGNSCFLNASLQCLAYCSPLVNALKDQSLWRGRGAIRSTDMVVLMATFLDRIHGSGKRKTFAPMEIINSLPVLSKGSMRRGRQEDAHEATRLILDGMQRSILARAGLQPGAVGAHAETSLVHRILGGYLQSQIKCPACAYESNTWDAFLDLSIEIRKRDDSVTKALERFAKVEVLDKDNMWKCGGCDTHVCARKHIAFKTAPKVLCLHLKRFSAFGGKIRSHVAFPFALDLAPYMAQPHKGLKYDLVGVLVHSGFSTHSGHYYSYVKAANGVCYSMWGLNIEVVTSYFIFLVL